MRSAEVSLADRSGEDTEVVLRHGDEVIERVLWRVDDLREIGRRLRRYMALHDVQVCRYRPVGISAGLPAIMDDSDVTLEMLAP